MLSMVQEIENAGSIFSFVSFAGCLDDLEINFILYDEIIMYVSMVHRGVFSRIGRRKLTCPIKAIVRPANAPPLKTRAAENPK